MRGDFTRERRGVDADKELLIAFGKRVRWLRRDQDMSQEALADAAGIHRNHVGAIERGAKQAGVLTIVRIAGALKVSVGSLFEG